jgi:hypothetical protein
MKWVICVVVNSGTGLLYIPVRENDFVHEYEDMDVAEAVMKGLQKHNPKVNFCIVGKH